MPPLYARDTELTRLAAGLDEALAGNGSVVLIAGEAGQGKTALMTAFAARAQAAAPDLLVAAGACNAFTGVGDPFLPFRELLHQLTGDVPNVHEIEPFEHARVARLRRFAIDGAMVLLEEGPHLVDTLVTEARLRARLEQHGADVGPAMASSRVMRDAQAQAGSSAFGQEALRAEAAAVLTQMALRSPLLLLLDDLQWADTSSLELFLQFARVIPGYPILVVGSYRPYALSGVAGGRHPLVSVVHELERQFGDLVVDLANSDGRGFLETLLDSEPNELGAAFRDALWRQTAGHPLFAIELLRAMQERGDIVRDQQGRWAVAPGLRWDALPARVTGVLGERFDRLGAFAQNVLRIASIEGEVFTVEVVAHVLGESPQKVAQLVAEALAKEQRLVELETVDRGPTGFLSRYRFRHNLIQRFVLDRVDASEARYLHEAVGDALVAVYADDVDPVAAALHFARGGRTDRAAPHQREAGHRARRAGALVDAIGYYRSALENGERMGLDARAALLHDLGECLWLRGDRPEAERVLGEASEAFERLGDRHALGSAQLALARVIYDQEAHFRRAGKPFERGLALLEEGPDTPELARAISAFALNFLITSEEDRALEWGMRSLAMAERLEAEGVRWHARMTVGGALAMLGGERREEGLDMVVESFAASARLGLVDDAGYAALVHADLLEALGRPEESERGWRRLIDYARRHQASGKEDFARLSLLRLLWRRGAWDAAFAELPFHRAQVAVRPRTSFTVAGIDLDLGRSGEASAVMNVHRHTLKEDMELRIVATSTMDLLRAAAAGGRKDEADAHAATIVRVCNGRVSCPFDAITPLLVAVTWWADRAGDVAREQARAGLGILEQTERQYGSPEACAALAQARGLVARAAGDLPSSAEHFVEARSAWKAAGFPLHEARASATAGHSLRLLGREDEAASALARARVLLGDLAAQIPEPSWRASFDRTRERMLDQQGASILCWT